MGNYTGFATLVGLDVHARSIEACGVVVGTGESLRKSFRGAGCGAEAAAWLAGLGPQPVAAAYESGCTGFALARQCEAAGVRCDVLAVSTIARSDKDRREKCDRRDAEVILREMANPCSKASRVRVPDERTEAQRELAREHRAAVDAVKRAKQRLLSFLLRHGVCWDERTASGRPKKAWTREFYRWLGKVDLGREELGRVLESLRRQLRAAEDEEAELRREVLELAGRPENAPYVAAISAVKGISPETALLARLEFGDFSRFRRGRAVSCWLGTVPSDGSSGETERHGGITKAGCSPLRRALVEAVAGIGAWRGPRKVPPAGASTASADLAARAAERAVARYRHLVRERGKHPNAARVAVANELVRWIWRIGLQVQGEQAAAGRRPSAD